MCALIVHFHYSVCTGCALAAVRLKMTSPKEEVIKGMEIQPLIIKSWKRDQGEVSCSCSWKSDLSTEKPGREVLSSSSSILPLDPQVDFKSGRGGRREQKEEGTEGYFISLLFLLHLPSCVFFSSARIEIQETWTKYFSYFKLLHYAFFLNVTKAFSSKGDEIPLMIVL